MIRLGTRGSALARWQAEWVQNQLTQHGHEVELVLVQTEGDQKSGPIASLGATGLFTKEIQQALLDGRIDVAVHSLKDLPTETLPELILAAVPPREEVRDALVTRHADSLANLPAGAIVGTGSTRRRAQLLHYRPDLVIRDVRGNVGTRLQKLDDGDYDAILLAVAGLVRLGMDQRITERISPDVVLPAVGQGALGIEVRAADTQTQHAVAVLDDERTHAAVLAERALLATLRGGCLAPVGAWAQRQDGAFPELLLRATVVSPDGTRRLTESGRCRLETSPTAASQELGRQVAQALLAAGAEELLEQARAENS